MALPKLHPWLKRIIEDAIPEGYYIQLRKFIPATDIKHADTVINYVSVPDFIESLGAPNPGNGVGGSVTVHDWAPDINLGEIQLKPSYNDFGLIEALPMGMEIQSDTVTLELTPGNEYLGPTVTCGTFNTPSDFFFYWKPEPVQGGITFAHNSINIHDIDADDSVFQLKVTEDGDLYVYSHLLLTEEGFGGGRNLNVVYTPGETILIQYDPSWPRFIIATESFSAECELDVPLNSNYRLSLNIYATIPSESSGGSVACRLSSSNTFGSAVGPDPETTPENIMPLEVYTDSALPVDAVPGDILVVTLGSGHWNDVNYGDLETALVIANNIVQHVVPLGVGRDTLEKAIEKVTPKYQNMAVSLGYLGDYTSLDELYEFLVENSVSGDHLHLTLLHGAFQDNPEPRLHFPMFNTVRVTTEPSEPSNYEDPFNYLGYSNLEIIGGISPIVLDNCDIRTDGMVTGDHVQFTNSTVESVGFSYRRLSANQSSAINTRVTESHPPGPKFLKKELRDIQDYKTPSWIGEGVTASAFTINSAEEDLENITIFGNNPEFTIKTPCQVDFYAGNTKAVSVDYRGIGVDGYLSGGPITAGAGANVNLKSLHWGSDGSVVMEHAVAVADGGIITTSRSKLDGWPVPEKWANQPVNVPTENGLVQMDAEVPANAQIIRLPIFQPTETVTAGSEVATFMAPFPIHLLGAYVTVSTPPNPDDSIYVDLTKLDSGGSYLKGQLIVNPEQITNDNGMDTVYEPMAVIPAQERIFVDVTNVTGTSTKGLDVYLVVIPTLPIPVSMT